MFFAGSTSGRALLPARVMFAGSTFGRAMLPARVVMLVAVPVAMAVLRPIRFVEDKKNDAAMRYSTGGKADDDIQIQMLHTPANPKPKARNRERERERERGVSKIKAKGAPKQVHTWGDSWCWCTSE